ncbi:MAG: hypothetical protein Q8P67_27825 [archaeon]|nr:hypothetical protein [archaeon]
MRIKAEFKFNVEHAANVLKWIEEVLSISLPDRDFYNALKSGEVLCDLLNKISPKAIPTTHRTSLAFKQMENISNYLRACREVLKMNDTDLFETADLFKKQNLSGVANHLDILARLAVTLPGGASLPKIQVTQALSLWSASLSEVNDFFSTDAPSPEASTPVEQELVRWANRQLSSYGEAKLAIRNLSSDLRSGIILIRLLEKLTSNSVGVYEQSPSSLTHCISNASQICRFLSSQLFAQIDFLQASDIVQGRTEALVKFVQWAREKFDLEFAFLSLLGRSTDVDPEELPTASTVTSTLAVDHNMPSSSPSSSSSSSFSSQPNSAMSPDPMPQAAQPTVDHEVDSKITENEKYLEELSSLVSQLQNRSSELAARLVTDQTNLDQLVASIEARTKAWAQEEQQYEARQKQVEALREKQKEAAKARQNKAIQELEDRRKQLEDLLERKQKELNDIEAKTLLARMQEVVPEPSPRETPAEVVEEAPAVASPTPDSPSNRPSSSSHNRSSKSSKDSSKSKSSSHSKSSRSSSSSKSSGDSKSSRSSSGRSHDRTTREQSAAIRAQFLELFNQSKLDHDAQLEELRQERLRSAEEFSLDRQKMADALEQLRKELTDQQEAFKAVQEQRMAWQAEWEDRINERKRTEQSWKDEDENRQKNSRAYMLSSFGKRTSALAPRKTPEATPRPPGPPPVAETPEVLAAQTAIRKRIMEEVLSTEESYVSALNTLEQGMYTPLKDVLSAKDHATFFSTLPELATVHRAFLLELKAAFAVWGDSSSIAHLFTKLDATPYFGYVAANPYLPLLLRLYRTRYPGFPGIVKAFESRQKSRLDVEALMIMPVQRLPRYVLLLREMRKYSSVAHAPERCQELDRVIATLQSSLDKINSLMDKRVNSSVPVLQMMVDFFEAPLNLHEAIISTSRILVTPPALLTFKRQEAPSSSGRPKSTLIQLKSSSVSHITSPKKNADIYGWLFNDLIVLAEKLPESPSDNNQSKTHRLVQLVTLSDFTAAWSDSKHPNTFGIDFCSLRWVFFTPSAEVRGEWLRGLHLLKETQQNQLFSLK